MSDNINHPPHYNAGKIEPIAVIRDWSLGFALGNAVKYIARAKHKGSELEDLKKAAWYLENEIETLEAAEFQERLAATDKMMRSLNRQPAPAPKIPAEVPAGGDMNDQF